MYCMARLLNAVVFFPTALRRGTRRNTIRLKTCKRTSKLFFLSGEKRKVHVTMTIATSPTALSDKDLIFFGLWLVIFGFVFGLTVALLLGRLLLDWLDFEAWCQPEEQEDTQATAQVIAEALQAITPERGWALCGDCYVRKLLAQMPAPEHEAWLTGATAEQV